jgi:hypothetical protein
MNAFSLRKPHSMSLRLQAADCSRWREPAVWFAMDLEPAKLATGYLTLEAIVSLSRLAKEFWSYFYVHLSLQ